MYKSFSVIFTSSVCLNDTVSLSVLMWSWQILSVCFLPVWCNCLSSSETFNTADPRAELWGWRLLRVEEILQLKVCQTLKLKMNIIVLPVPFQHLFIFLTSNQQLNSKNLNFTSFMLINIKCFSSDELRKISISPFEIKHTNHKSFCYSLCFF